MDLDRDWETPEVDMWIHPALRIQVLSSFYLMGDDRIKPQYHISFTRYFVQELCRPGKEELNFVVGSFLEIGQWWEEDNHFPGNARHIWIPILERDQYECECKNEMVITTTDGYKFSYDGSYDIAEAEFWLRNRLSLIGSET